MYTPLTQMGMNFLMNGGALVPMDGKAGVLPGSLPDGAIPRAYVVDMASFGLQFYAAIRRLMPAWEATWTATLLAQETSVLGSCVETVHLSNLLLQAINTSSSFSNILSVVGNGAGLATWAASNLCNVLPVLCTSNSQSVSISQSGEQAGQTELSINTQAGDLILRPLQDPYVWLNGLSPEGGDGGSPLSPPTENVNETAAGGGEATAGGGEAAAGANAGISAGAIAGISVGSTAVCAAIIFGALRARRRSKSAQVRVQPKSNTHATDVHK